MSHCPGGDVIRACFYFADAGRDVIAQKNAAVSDGQNDGQKEGPLFDEGDVTCSPCPEGAYCPGGGGGNSGNSGNGRDGGGGGDGGEQNGGNHFLGEKMACPERATSPLGSDEAADCVCSPGAFSAEPAEHGANARGAPQRSTGQTVP
ncbi:hypothetical protein T484DRAFT_1765960 [Baffinella frigidus]|nr:hypothetical protein T484DRAFT_1765960 [Cryptophyta sp. CCMP2293]